MTAKRAKLLSTVWGLFGIVNVVQAVFAYVSHRGTAAIALGIATALIGFFLMVAYARTARK